MLARSPLVLLAALVASSAALPAGAGGLAGLLGGLTGGAVGGAAAPAAGATAADAGYAAALSRSLPYPPPTSSLLTDPGSAYTGLSAQLDSLAQA